MFNMEWQGKVASIKTAGKEGEHVVEVQFVAGAEDALFSDKGMGPAARRAYRDVKAGRLGTTEIKMQKRWLCNLTLSYMAPSGKAEQLKTSRAIPEKLQVVASKKSDNPPKVKMKVSIEYSEKNGELVYLGKAHKKQVTVMLEGIQEGLPFGPDTTEAKPPKKREAQAELPAAAPVQ